MSNLSVNLLSAMSKTFELFGLEIHWYGVILTTGMVCALFLLIFLGKRESVEPEFCLTAFLFAIIFAIIGARLFYVLPRADEYFSSWSDFLRAFDISEGGLTIIGGIPMGALGLLIACIIYKKSFVRVCDLVVPCLLLGQVIGRWGNFVNRELYGFAITDPALQKFPFAVWICPHDEIHWSCASGQWHAANFFYEMMLNLLMLIIMLVLTYTIKKKLKVGFMSGLYIVWYGVVRGILEFVKVGQLMWGGVRAVQLVCFLCAAAGVVLLILLQVGVIKFETPRMYEKHFKLVHEPPAFEVVKADKELTSDNSFDINTKDGNLKFDVTSSKFVDTTESNKAQENDNENVEN